MDAGQGGDRKAPRCLEGPRGLTTLLLLLQVQRLLRSQTGGAVMGGSCWGGAGPGEVLALGA